MTNKEIFENLVYDNIHRDGINDFMKFLEIATDFFIAPASTKYHGSYEGGLLDHSLAVHHELGRILTLYQPEWILDKALIESMTIVSLFHDVCKRNMYVKSTRNVKNSDGNWEAIPCYIINPDAPDFGAHGAYSVYLITQYMFLTKTETMAIYHHMGAFNAAKYDNISKAYENNLLVWALHVADEAATYIKGV